MALNKEKLVASDIIRIAEQYYTSWPKLIARAFVNGLFTALGATVGFGLIVWIAGFVLDSLGVLPVVGQFFGQLNTVLHEMTK